LVFWQDALAKSPNKKRIHGYIGNVYRDRGDMPKALQEYRLMLANDFRYWQDHFELGVMMQENGFYRKAVDEYLIALKIAPSQTSVYAQLAKAYRALGEFENAIRAEKMNAAGTSAGGRSASQNKGAAN
jgi:tetratricopeptide (TPR) repeat protein